jgi:hypothetical protein
MDKNTLNLTFQVFKDVDCLVAGDGEPFLNFDGVKRMISKVIKGKIRAKTFFPGVLPVRDLDSTAEVTVCRAETGIESTTNDVWNCAIIFDGLNLFLELKRIWNSLRNL